MHEWLTSLPSLHNTSYALFPASLLHTLHFPQAFPALSGVHLPFLSTHSHSSPCCFVVLPAILFLPLPPFSVSCCFVKYYSSIFFSIPCVIHIHLSSVSLSSSLYSYISSCEPLSHSHSVSSLQRGSSTCPTTLPVVSHLKDICGLAISDSFRQEMRANLSPSLTPHQLLLFVFTAQICCP